MVIYKYTRPSLVEAFLARNTLAFPLYKQLNDPYESIAFIPPKTPRGASASLRWDVMDFKSAYDPPGTAELFPRGRNLSFVELNNQLKTNAARWLSVLRHTAGILSLTSDPLNVLMWAHYADNHRGVCIGFEREALEDGIPFGEGCWWPSDLREQTQTARRVDYSEDRPKFVHQVPHLLISAFFTKSSCWSYEQEWRLLRPVESDMQGFVDLKPLPITALKEVILGLNAAPTTIEQVHKICNLYPEVKLFRMFQIKDCYAIDRQALV